MKLLCALVAMSLVGVPQLRADEEPKVGRLKVEPITLEDNQGNKVQAEMGRVWVPENRTKKDSRLIEIAFLRIKHPGKQSGAPTFLLAGGPGGSGIDMAKGTLGAGRDVVLNYFGGDIIGVDQRGTGASKPNLRTSVLFGFPLEQPGDPEKMLPVVNKVCRKVVKDFEDKGIDLTGYNTAENADDINAVREALGYKRINLWGGSYGSHLAFAVIRRHDKHLERVVVQSPEGPNHTYKLPSQIEAGLQSISKIVAKDPKIGKKVPDLAASLKKILQDLEKQPKVVEIKHPLTGLKVKVGISKFDVQLLVANAIGRVRTMRVVPAAVYAMERGDFSSVAQQLAAFRTFAGPRSAMSMMMDSASSATPQRLRQIAREAKQCLLGDAVNFPFPGARSAWGNPDLGEDFRGPLRSKVKILFICGDLDSRTPIRNGKELMTGLPNSQMISVENGAHDFSVVRIPELRTAVGNFLKDQPIELERFELPVPKFDPIKEAPKPD